MRAASIRWIAVFTIAALACLAAPAVVAPRKTYARATTGYSFKRLSSPARTTVSLDGRWVARFTDGARTVTLAGPTRTFDEATANDAVTTDVWARLSPLPFTGEVDVAWLSRALADTSPDLLATGMGYIADAPDIHDAAGLRVAGDASYGPLQPDGTREEGSDFNDYLGIDWSYGSSVDPNEGDQIGSLDCSGFLRMVFGYRHGLSLSIGPDGGASLPRRSFQMYDSAPGVVVVPDSGSQVAAFKKFGAGDLVFFDASTDGGTRIDHVGMYLGRDAAGHYRFISSRKSIDGPTLGDYRGRSVLDGTGLYASSFRAVRRL